MGGLSKCPKNQILHVTKSDTLWLVPVSTAIITECINYWINKTQGSECTNYVCWIPHYIQFIYLVVRQKVLSCLAFRFMDGNLGRWHGTTNSLAFKTSCCRSKYDLIYGHRLIMRRRHTGIKCWSLKYLFSQGIYLLAGPLSCRY